MAFEICRQDVRRLPPVGQGVLHARIRCGMCRHHKDFTEAPPEDIEALSEAAVCSKCGARQGRIDVFVVAPKLPQTARRERCCLACDQVISEEFLLINPFTLYCVEHLALNPAVQPRLHEPLGTRTDVERDTIANRAAAYCGDNHSF